MATCANTDGKSPADENDRVNDDADSSVDAKKIVNLISIGSAVSPIDKITRGQNTSRRR